MLRLRSTERGDTIIEVLIAIAIVSLVLVSAFVISNQNTQAIQANQERLQAQHLVEGQIEALLAAKGLAAGDTCFDASAAPASSADCVRSGVDGSGATYTLAVSGPVASVYTVSAQWTGLGDKTNNASKVTMYYRLD